MQTTKLLLPLSMLLVATLPAQAQWRTANSTPQLPRNVQIQQTPVQQAPRFQVPAPAPRIVQSVPQFAPPLRGPMVVAPQGRFMDPAYPRTEKRQHLGTDYAARGNTPVYAATNGQVQSNNTNLNNPFNSQVTVKQQNGGQVVYGHVYSTTTPGQTVRQGQHIGYVQPANPVQPEYKPHLHVGVNEKGLAGQSGWGRAPETTTRQQAEHMGWRDFQSSAP